MNAKRVASMGEMDTKEVCYWKESDGVWMIYLPGCGVGSLANHKIQEHEDGTITVSPSILMRGHSEEWAPTQKHGYLENGEWRDC